VENKKFLDKIILNKIPKRNQSHSETQRTTKSVSRGSGQYQCLNWDDDCIGMGPDPKCECSICRFYIARGWTPEKDWKKF
jgi:hypothetical protein